MIYDVRQTTSYDYEAKVSFAHHVLRLTPIDRPRQRVLAAALDIEPAPLERRDGKDFFGNRLTWVALDESHERFVVKVAARVVLDDGTQAPPDTPAWEVIREAVEETIDLGPQSPAHFIFPSRKIALDEAIRAYAATSFPPGRAILEGAIELMRRIHDDFVYDAEATSVSTDPATSFALRRGVCQDFTHIMITGLRGLQLPAAYVSGYLRTEPPPGQPRLAGADAMHAWVALWCGEQAGWWGLDPTNAAVAGSDHIVLAIGRDYADIAPIGGIVYVSGEQQIETSVDVKPV
jgi:transglutaminase-like putative cysteine protease